MRPPPGLRITDIFHRIPVFAGVTEDEIDRLLKICKSAAFRAGETLCTQGEPSDRMFICLAGEIEIKTARAGVIHVMKSGELFGEMGVVTDQTRSASAVARSDVTALLIAKLDFEILVSHNQRIGMVMLQNMVKILSKRIADANQQIESLAQRDPAGARPPATPTPRTPAVPAPPGAPAARRNAFPAGTPFVRPISPPVPILPPGLTPLPTPDGPPDPNAPPDRPSTGSGLTDFHFPPDPLHKKSNPSDTPA